MRNEGSFESEIQQAEPKFWHAALTFLSIIAVIAFGLFFLKTSLHSLMLVCLLIAGVSAWPISSKGFHSIRRAMNSGIEQAFSAIYIFILIGVLIAALIQCGAVATLIYYGLKLISPAVFLPAGLILCSLMSVATGTSWGTAGTAGIVMVGIVMVGEDLDTMLGGLANAFNIGPLTLLPLVVMLLLAVCKVSAEVAMMAATVAGVILAVTIQDAHLAAVLSSLHSGGSFETGIETLDKLFSRGGIESMMWTLSLALLALALGGILNKFGFLSVLVKSMLQKITSAASLITTTILSGIVGNMCMGEAYITIILGGQLFGTAYDEQGLDRATLSRSIEEGATLSTALIPWTTAGAFFATTLGVSTLEYLPWALFNLFSPCVAIVFAWLGVAQLSRLQESHELRSSNSV